MRIQDDRDRALHLRTCRNDGWTQEELIRELNDTFTTNIKVFEDTTRQQAISEKDFDDG